MNYMKRIKFIIIAIGICIIAVTGFYLFSRWQANQQQEEAVIQQIRTLNRWETASYTIEQVIDSGSGGNVFQRFLFGDRILLIAHGTVVGGFDLASLSNNSIQTNGKNITIQLPAPEILSTSLDESQTRVY